MRKKKLSLRSVIRRQMEAQGMSQSDLANLLGTSRQYVNGYLTGRCNISHDHIETLLDYFDLVKEPDAPK